MKINIEYLKKYIKEKFHDNQTYFANEIKVDKSYLNQLINGKKSNSSAVFVNRIIEYCKKNNLNENDFIILE